MEKPWHIAGVFIFQGYQVKLAKEIATQGNVLVIDASSTLTIQVHFNIKLFLICSTFEAVFTGFIVCVCDVQYGKRDSASRSLGFGMNRIS